MRQQAARRRDLSPDEITLTSGEVAEIAKVSLRQLQWWDERKILALSRKGQKRVYLPRDAIEILVIAELRRKGLSLQIVRRIIRTFRREMEGRYEEVLQGKTELYLLTDGKSVHLEEAHPDVINVLKTARRPMLLVSISDAVRLFKSAWEAGKARRAPRRKRSRSVRDQLSLF